jgi:hypothetical protein
MYVEFQRVRAGISMDVITSIPNDSSSLYVSDRLLEYEDETSIPAEVPFPRNSKLTFAERVIPISRDISAVKEYDRAFD